MPNSHKNGNRNPNSSGVSVNFQLSESQIAGLLASSLILGASYAGYAMANNQIQNVNQNCTVGHPITTSVSKPMPLTRKD